MKRCNPWRVSLFSNWSIFIMLQRCHFLHLSVKSFCPSHGDICQNQKQKRCSLAGEYMVGQEMIIWLMIWFPLDASYVVPCCLLKLGEEKVQIRSYASISIFYVMCLSDFPSVLAAGQTLRRIIFHYVRRALMASMS